MYSTTCLLWAFYHCAFYFLNFYQGSAVASFQESVRSSLCVARKETDLTQIQGENLTWEAFFSIFIVSSYCLIYISWTIRWSEFQSLV